MPNYAPAKLRLDTLLRDLKQSLVNVKPDADSYTTIKANITATNRILNIMALDQLGLISTQDIAPSPAQESATADYRIALRTPSGTTLHYTGEILKPWSADPWDHSRFFLVGATVKLRVLQGVYPKSAIHIVHVCNGVNP